MSAEKDAAKVKYRFGSNGGSQTDSKFRGR